MSQKFADRLKVSGTAGAAGVFNMGAAATGCRTLAQVITEGSSDPLEIKVGDTGVRFTISDGSGNWLEGSFTITTSSSITLETIESSSAAGASPTFSGTLTIYNCATAKFLRGLLGAADGIGMHQLTAAPSTPDTYVMPIADPATGNTYSVTVATLKALFGAGAGTGGATDTTAPTASSAAVANATPTVVAITMSEAMNTSFVPAAAAFTVGGHTVSSVAISGSTINLTVSAAFVNGEAARTVSYTQPGTNNARDVAGNLLANFTGLAITNNVAAAANTLDTKYAMRSTDGNGGTAAVKYPAPGNISTNGFYVGDVSLYIRDGAGVAALASEVVMWAWSKRSGGVPVKPDLSTYTQNGQKRAPSRLGGWTDAQNPGSNGYYGLYDNSAGGTLYIWGTAGTYDLWLFYSDGSAEPYDNGTGTPVGLVLT
jgi:hypothetical protein